MAVNKDKVRLLVGALRSDRFIQCSSRLERVIDGERRNCCLGVACRVAIENGLKVEVWDAVTATAFDDEVFVLPRSVREYYGFDSSDPVIANAVIGTYTPITAATANDVKFWSFAMIADAFEQMYLSD